MSFMGQSILSSAGECSPPIVQTPWDQRNLEISKEYYRKAILRGVYTVAQLKSIYNDYESHRKEWKLSGYKNYKNYCRGQDALKAVIEEFDGRRY